MKNWNVWSRTSTEIELGIADTFLNSLWSAKNYKTFRIGKKTRESLKDWISRSVEILKIDDDPDTILEKFLSNGFIEYYYRKQRK